MSRFVPSLFTQFFFTTLLCASFFPAQQADSSEHISSPALSYNNCQNAEVLSDLPEKVLAIDINTVEIVLALGGQLAATAGVGEASALLESYREAFGKVPSLSPSYPSPTAILKGDLRFDLVLGGWNAGFFEGSPLTPEALKKQGIASYVMRETCPSKDPQEPLTIESGPLADIANIARLIGREEAGTRLIKAMQNRLARVETEVGRYGRSEAVRLFVYDSGSESPFTAGSGSSLRDVLRRAGGQLLDFGLDSNWGTVSWDRVASAAPEVILIVDYGFGDGERKRKLLERRPELAGVPAVKNRNFFIIPYAAALSGVRSVGLVELLADHLLCSFSPYIDQGAFTCYEQPHASSH